MEMFLMAAVMSLLAVAVSAVLFAAATGLRDHVHLALADSEFSRRELEALGFAPTGVLPIHLDFARYREPPSPVLLRQLDDERTNLLFVGRVAPHKRHEDLVRLASYWKRFLSPAVRLVLVGRLPRRSTGDGRPLKAHYLDALRAFAYEEGLTPEEVVFTGHLDHRDLLAAYAAADVFVSMSEHEGFGVPLVEAMLMRVPVLARRAAAVGFTLGEAGVTLIGIVWWAYSDRRKQAYEKAARQILDDDMPPSGERGAGQTNH